MGSNRVNAASIACHLRRGGRCEANAAAVGWVKLARARLARVPLAGVESGCWDLIGGSKAAVSREHPELDESALDDAPKRFRWTMRINIAGVSNDPTCRPTFVAPERVR
jgi:hypothetical protein